MAKKQTAAAASIEGWLNEGIEKMAIKLDAKVVAAQHALEAQLGLGVAGGSFFSQRIVGATFASVGAGNQPINNSNLIGTGISEKTTQGSLTGETCIRVYVSQKVNLGAIQSGAVPKEINGVPTDVVECGPISFSAINGGFFTRPIPSGVGVAPEGSNMVGTLGARCVADNKWCILSNNHVFALNNQMPLGTMIVQPVFGSHPSYSIGRLLKFVPLSETTANTVDAAIAHTDPAYVSSSHRSFTVTDQPTAAFGGQSVRKDGYMTGGTSGRVVTLNVSIPVQTHTGKVYNFTNQIEINGNGGLFSTGGDSGSLIVEDGTFRPVALLFAGDDQTGRTFATPIQLVMQALGITDFK